MIYYNIMEPPSYMRSVVNRNVVMRRIHVIALSDIYQTKDTRKQSAIMYLLHTNFGDRGGTVVNLLAPELFFEF